MTETFEFLTPQLADRPYTISEINDGVCRILEAGNTVVLVEGEISNWKPSSSGHCYFRLKDQDCQIPAVLWRSSVAQLQFKPKDGDAVLVIGSLRVYKKGGYYQLDVHRMQPLGSGALFIAFEQLKKRLEKEGLFDPCYKKPLPPTINSIGIVTSKNGAAIRDIIRVVASRAPQTEIVLIDVQVQGEKAAGEIVNAIRMLNEFGKVDCIIAGRGGGSIEDLWAFNEEIVARAIFDSEIPVISAVGHEVDFTIADFVADVRAPTPSAAAEIAVSDNRESRKYFTTYAERFSGAIERYFENIQYRYQKLIKRNALKRPLRMLLESYQHRDELEERARRNLEITLQQKFSRLSATTSKLNALSPLSVLARGYGVITLDNGAAVRSSRQITPGSIVKLQFFEGTAGANIISTDQESKDGIAF